MDKAKITLFELIGGIVSLTFIEIVILTIIEIGVDVLWVNGIIKLIVGAVCGTIVAVGLVYNMYVTLGKALTCEPHDAESIVRKNSILRMLVLFTIIVISVYFFYDYINLYMCFLSIMNLKFAVYLQPFTNKIFIGYIKGR